jgi:iron-sulfur cluster insertion protein
MALPGEGEGGGVTAELVFYYMLLYLKYSEYTQNEIKIMTPVEITTSPLLFSDAAATKVRELIAEEGDERLMLRVFISGGGCSGFQYGFTFEESLGEEDTVVENQGVKLLIDPMSYQYLTGAEIDYTEGLEGAQFVIRNPNATTTCGCGSSFSV